MNKGFQSRFAQRQNEIYKKSRQIQKTAKIILVLSLIAVQFYLV